jgi:hypothetical protein
MIRIQKETAMNTENGVGYGRCRAYSLEVTAASCLPVPSYNMNDFLTDAEGSFSSFASYPESCLREGAWK